MISFTWFFSHIAFHLLWRLRENDWIEVLLSTREAGQQKTCLSTEKKITCKLCFDVTVDVFCTLESFAVNLHLVFVVDLPFVVVLLLSIPNRGRKRSKRMRNTSCTECINTLNLVVYSEWKAVPSHDRSTTNTTIITMVFLCLFLFPKSFQWNSIITSDDDVMTEGKGLWSPGRLLSVLINTNKVSCPDKM